MSDEGPPKKKQPEGLPAYMGTFADLMSLLMCFFVLLLSFAEMDAFKYKMVVKSLENAFGVQRDVAANEIPKGTSIIAQEFSPGEPKPTPLRIVRQDTADDKKRQDQGDRDKQKNDEVEIDKEQLEKQLAKETAEETQQFKIQLEDEINSGMLDVENQLSRIVIRIREKGSFSSGDARLNPDFIPILKKINDVLKNTSGLIAIAGHTDNVPISTLRYRSNWELSSSRATSVVHEILNFGDMDSDRFYLEGYADTRPIVPNDTAANRAQNRRVEIIVLKTPLLNNASQSIEELKTEHESIESEVTPLENSGE